MEPDRHGPVDEGMTAQRYAIVGLELSDEQRIEFQKAAERSGMSLEGWMIDRLNLAAKREAKEA